MNYEHVPKINRELMPQPAATRTIRYRYDWHLLQPGEGFEFGPTVKMLSARVMCANNGKQLGWVFRCYRGVDQKLYAIRMDGLGAELPKAAGVANAPRITAATAPAAREVYGDFGHRQPDNLKIITNLPPPSQPSRYELHSNEAALERLRGPSPGTNPVMPEDDE